MEEYLLPNFSCLELQTLKDDKKLLTDTNTYLLTQVTDLTNANKGLEIEVKMIHDQMQIDMDAQHVRWTEWASLYEAQVATEKDRLIQETNQKTEELKVELENEKEKTQSLKLQYDKDLYSLKQIIEFQRKKPAVSVKPFMTNT